MRDSPRLDFKAAVEHLRESITREQIAEELGVSYYSVMQALLPAQSAAYRSPPQSWQRGVADLARKRAAELLTLALQIDRDSRKLTSEKSQ